MKVFAKVFLLPLFLLVSCSTQVFAVNAAQILEIFEIASSSKQEEKESSQWNKKVTSTSYRETTIFTSESYPNFYFQLQIPTGDGHFDRPFHFALFYGAPSPRNQAVWSISECVDAQTLSALFKLSFEELLKFLEDKIAGMGSSPARNLLQAFVSMIKEYIEYLAQQAQANATVFDDNDLFAGDDPFSEEDDIFAPTREEPGVGNQDTGNQNQTEAFPALDPQAGALIAPLLLSIASLSALLVVQLNR